MLDLGGQSFDTFSPRTGIRISVAPGKSKSAREHMERIATIPARSMPIILAKTAGQSAAFRRVRDWVRPIFPPPLPGRSAARAFLWCMILPAMCLQRFEAQKFGRDEGRSADVERVLNCDLLILDDLGTELTTAFVAERPVPDP